MARKKHNTHTNSYSPNTSDCNLCLGTECSQKRAFNWKLNQLLCPSKNECVSSFAFAIKKVIEFRHFLSFENQLRIGIASRSRETHARAAPVFALFVSTTSVCCYNALVALTCHLKTYDISFRLWIHLSVLWVVQSLSQTNQTWKERDEN